MSCAAGRVILSTLEFWMNINSTLLCYLFRNFGEKKFDKICLKNKAFFFFGDFTHFSGRIRMLLQSF
jgi:hypothetical protein